MNQEYRYTIDGDLLTWPEIAARTTAAGIDRRTALARINRGIRTWAGLLESPKSAIAANLAQRRAFVHNCVRRAQR